VGCLCPSLRPTGEGRVLPALLPPGSPFLEEQPQQQRLGFSPSYRGISPSANFMSHRGRNKMTTGYEAVISICKRDSTKEEMRTNFHMYSPC